MDSTTPDFQPARARPGVEVHSINYIPRSERHGKAWHQATMWFAGNAVLTTLAVGLIGITLGLSLFWTLVSETLGVLFGTFFMAMHSVQGPRLGIPQMIQSRPQFGFFGALLPQGVALLLYIGFNVFNIIIAGQALHAISGLPTKAALAVTAVAAYVVAFSGYDVLHLFQRWGTYLFLLIFGVFTIGALATVHLPAKSSHVGSFHLTPFLVVFAAATAYQLSEAPYVSDYSRYLGTNVTARRCFSWTYAGAALGTLWMVWLGAFLLSGDPHAQLVPLINSVGDGLFTGFGRICLAAALLFLITVIAMNMYGGSLAAITMADSVKRVAPRVSIRVITLGIVGAASLGISLASSENFLNNYNNFLTMLLYFLIPWTAINLVDYYFVRRERYAVKEIFKSRGIYGRWQWQGLLAYGIGFVVMVPFFSTPIYTGPVAHALHGADLSIIVGLAVASGAYYLFCYRRDLTAEFRAALDSESELEHEPVVMPSMTTTPPAEAGM
jgi:NCS1 family nucleobase:cation symporter-1